MAKAPTITRPAVPLGLGRTFCEVIETARTLEGEQVVNLITAHSTFTTSAGDDDPAPQRYAAATRRVTDALDSIGLDVAEITEGLTQASVDAALAVLARDRGVISDTDFRRLTAPWQSEGLPLPAASTGDVDDDVPLDMMTTDRICDELLHAAKETKWYGAAMALTGFNYGDLLVYDFVRQFITGRAGDLGVRWADLHHALTSDEFSDQLTDIPIDALDALAFCATLADPDQLDDPDATELMTLAFVYALGTQHMLDLHWEFPPDNLPPAPAATSAPLAGEPGS